MAARTETVVESKPWWESKTMIANGLTLAVVIVTAALQLPEVVTLIPDSWWKYIAGIAAIANLILRVVTSQPIMAHPPAPPVGE